MAMNKLENDLEMQFLDEQKEIHQN